MGEGDSVTGYVLLQIFGNSLNLFGVHFSIVLLIFTCDYLWVKKPNKSKTKMIISRGKNNTYRCVWIAHLISNNVKYDSSKFTF